MDDRIACAGKCVALDAWTSCQDFDQPNQRPSPCQRAVEAVEIRNRAGVWQPTVEGREGAEA